MKAAILGASGLVGQELVDQLLANDAYEEVHVLVRRPMNRFHQKLEEWVIDFDRVTEIELPTVDHVYCALGTTIKQAGSQAAFRQVDYTYPIEVGRELLDLGATRFALISALGAHPNAKTFYNRVKGDTENGLRVLGYEALLIFRPSLLLGEREEFRFGEQAAARVSTVLRPLLKRSPYAPIEAGKVAKAMMERTLHAPPGITIVESKDMQK
ncbi:NAD-dependent epimerase/dehydratase family protein [Exiguobacterium sp. s80]|uniref:NAD-dependent epimerase/dehydratase family protein n=1 Tax=Exiguobacterium sp. s80 TaxID=2751209 RepID=UPI001BE73DD7|nr:NAD-dependent epimerase/dehydratase family protein [Exiguobacterium sp. s80]